MPIERHHVKSKLAVAYQLSHLPETASHIPDTELLGKSSLKRMTKKYDKVYLKPDRGRKSRGVVRIERMKNGEFKLRQETQTKVVKADVLWPAVEKLTGDTKYLIQQAVNSVTKDLRHFSFRRDANLA
jgi:DNA-directed RNA polymerase beta' subunit